MAFALIQYEPIGWLLLAAIAAAAVLGVLNTIAAAIRQETDVHDLKIRVAVLQKRYADQLRVLYGYDEEPFDVDPIEDQSATPDAAAPLQMPAEDPSPATAPAAKAA